MSIIAMPATLVIGDFSIGQRRFDMTEMSGETGNTKARLKGPPRWQLSMAAPSNGLQLANASIWEALLLQLRGGVNHMSAWDIARPLPRGSCRGTMTLNGAHSAGAVSLSISVTGQTGLTLLMGDWLQVGTGLTGQLFKVMADATAGASTIVVTVEPPMRIGMSDATAVNYTNALCHYKMVSPTAQWSVNPGFNTIRGFAADFIEQWA
jgi:hypothetical protein